MTPDPSMRCVRPLRTALALLALLACSGCTMLGAIFDAPGLRLIVLVVVVIAAVGFVVSRSERR